MSDDRYITNAQYRAQKARLTKAKNSGDPKRVLEAVEKTLEEWDGKVWPDDWHRWNVALSDALFAYDRSDAIDDPEAGDIIDRFLAALGVMV